MNRGKSIRRSFVLPADVMHKLRQIQVRQNLDNPSQALVFAIGHSHESLFDVGKATKSSELTALVKKNLVIQKYILVELAKLSGGQSVQTEEASTYLARLNEQVKKHLQKIGA